MSRATLRARTYEPVDEGVVRDVPAILAAVLDDVRLVAGEPVTQHVLTEHFDTVDRRLRAAGAAIRRVQGSDDDGWHADLAPADRADRQLRRTVSLVHGRRTVPAALRRLVWTVTDDVALAPVARVTTDRTVHPLLSAEGAPRASIAVERVDVRRVDDGAETPVAGWVHLRLDSLDGDRALFRALDHRLRSLGLPWSAERPEVEELLGIDQPIRTSPAPADVLGPKSATGEVVGGYLAAQVRELVRQDPMVRLDVPGSVHQMRVATRRLRSGLRTYRVLFDGEASTRLTGELRWLAAQLGAARDAEVLRHRLLSDLGDEPAFERPIRQATAQLDRHYRQAYRALVAALDSDRYHVLVEALRLLGSQVPDTKAAARRVDRLGARLVAKADRRVHRTMTAAVGLPASAQRDQLLHDARKAAKQARYAAEAVAPAIGDQARSYAAAMSALQEELGQRQDAVLAQRQLLALAVGQPWDLAFLYGRLHAREAQRVVSLDTDLDQAWHAACADGTREWLGDSRTS